MNEFKILDTKLNTVEETIMSDLVKQDINFQENKKNKLKRKKNKEIIIAPNIKRASTSLGRRGSKIDGIIESLSIFYLMLASTQKGQYDIMKDILEFSEKQAKLNQEKVSKEIDEYIATNKKEMNEAIEEIKFSYTEDMKEIDGIK